VDVIMTIARLHHLGLTVADVDVSASWYATVLGFQRAGDFTSSDGSRRKVFLGHERMGVRLGLCEHARSDRSRFDETRVGLDHLAFAVDSIDELNEWERRLQESNVTYTPVAPANTIEGAYVLVFRDPDNIQLELVAEQ